MTRRFPRSVLRTFVLRNLVLVACYAATAVLCFRLTEISGGFAATIWIPEGFAVAAVLLYGRALLPGVWLGDFIPNFCYSSAQAHHQVLLAAVIALGHVACVLTISELLPGFKGAASFLHLEQVVQFLRATVIGTLVSASIGVVAIKIAHPLLQSTPTDWAMWWIGNSLGILVLAPMFITLLTEEPKQKKINIAVSRLVAPATFVVLALITFWVFLPPKMMSVLLGFSLYSIAIFGAFVFPLSYMFMTTTVVSAISVARTFEKIGLYRGGELVQGMQVFIGGVSVMVMILNALVSERLSADEILYNREKALLKAEKMSALGEMASGIAHEIGNPLMVIYARTEQALMLLQEGRGNATELVPVLEKIQFTAERIDQIVKSVRFLSRDAEKDPFRPASMKQIVSDTIELCKERFEKTGVQLDIEPLLQDAPLECKPALIGQVLLNLLSNARDAALESPNPWVKVSFPTVQEGHIEISVEDSGAGIPESVRHEIFRPFFTTKVAGRGTGLGLSVSKKIVNAHRGTLFFDEAHSSTRFVVRLPVQQSTPPNAFS